MDELIQLALHIAQDTWHLQVLWFGGSASPDSMGMISSAYRIIPAVGVSRTCSRRVSLKAVRSVTQQEKTKDMCGCGRQEQALLDVYAAEGWRGSKKEAVRPYSELARAAKQVCAARVTVQGLVNNLVLESACCAHTPLSEGCLTQSMVMVPLQESTSCKA